MPKHGKKYRAATEKVERHTRYDLLDAVKLVKETSYTTFDATVEVSVRLGVNPRHADQMVRGAVVLPHGTGKSVRVAVFAKGDKAREAEEAGADVVGQMDLVDKIKEGWLEFDKAIATPDMMGTVGRIGRILGPRGLMPNPKSGSVTFDIAQAVSEAKGGKVDFRVEKAGIIHAGVGKVSFSADKLAANIRALYDRLIKLKPATVKGTYVRGITIAATMGPGVKVNEASLEAGVAH
ncbi:MAG: 50S ribosomal protein L1 [Deltaproteobacteria bacterium]|nr:MAG: 50S ribosomal protein L1 [Deltaproteobacteria bacterium]